MNILAIQPDFDCDTQVHPGFLRAVVELLASGGRRTTVLAARYAGDKTLSESHRTEVVRGVEVQRIRLLRESNSWRAAKAFNLAWFLLRALIHAVVGKKYDLIVASNRPSSLIGWVLRATRSLRGIPYVYLCQELYPEASNVNEDATSGRLFNQMLRWETATCISARRVVLPSHDMAKTLIARGVPPERISIIRPFLHAPSGLSASPRQMSERSGVARFLYVGELSRLRGLERLIAAARLVAGRVPFHFIFIGDGDARGELVELAGDLLGRRIEFLRPQSFDATVRAMQGSDYGVVSLAGDAHLHTYPLESVLFGWAGCPVIAMVDPQIELAQEVAQNDEGYVVPSRSVSGIAETIVKAVVERRRWTPQRRLQLAARSRCVFSRAAAQSAWNQVIAGDTSELFAMPPCGRTSQAA